MCGIRNMVYSTYRVPYSTSRCVCLLHYKVPPTLPPDVTVYCNIKFPFSVMVNMDLSPICWVTIATVKLTGCVCVVLSGE